MLMFSGMMFFCLDLDIFVVSGCFLANLCLVLAENGTSNGFPLLILIAGGTVSVAFVHRYVGSMVF
jgi:hypothetical protein